MQDFDYACPATIEDAVAIIGNDGTLGGNICNAAPSADAVPALICHQASVRVAGPNGTRDELLETFVRGPGKTSLAAGELLLSIVLPLVTPRSAGTYLRFTPRRETDIAIAGTAAWVRLDAESGIELLHCRVACTFL